MAKKVTRDDVARLAGVSPAVVSYVVNDGPKAVSPKSRRKVEEAIDRLGYRPNATARAMKLGRTDTFGLIVSEITNTFYAEVVEAVENKSLDSGKSVFLGHSQRDPNIERKMLRNMADRGVEGILLLMTSESDAAATTADLSVPTVFLDRFTPILGSETISSDYYMGGRLATEHLLEHGYRDILPVQGKYSPDTPNGRLEGYQDTMIEARMLPRKPVVTTWDRQGGYEAGKSILRSGSPLPRAIFCFSDMIGVGMLRALQEAGISVPQDVAVVSFDGTIAGEYSWPPLTSVRQPIEEMTSHAVDWLSNDRRPPGTHTLYPVELEVRESCGCALSD